MKKGHEAFNEGVVHRTGKSQEPTGHRRADTSQHLKPTAHAIHDQMFGMSDSTPSGEQYTPDSFAGSCKWDLSKKFA